MSAVRKALEAAAMEQCCDNWDEMDADDRAVAMSFTAPAIAKFLRGIADYAAQSEAEPGDIPEAWFRDMAAAVEAAAREGA